MLQEVPVAIAQIHVVQPVVVVPSLTTDELGQMLQVSVSFWPDLEDLRDFLGLDIDLPVDPLHPLDPIEALQPPPHLPQALALAVDVEAGSEAGVLNAAYALVGPEPQDYGVLPVVRIGVDDPALQFLPPES